MNTQQEYFDTLAAAFIRGKLQDTPIQDTNSAAFTKPLAELSREDIHTLFQLAKAHALRIHRFKRTMGLARVQKVLGILKGIQPTTLLDIGSGRGAFLWPLLDTFPHLPVTAVDTLDYRIADIQAVHAGGIAQLTGLQADVTALPLEDNAFDAVTMLEVLEHIPDTCAALSEVCRVARRFLLLSVPSKADSNPEHIHLFDQQRIRAVLTEQGITRITVDYVLNHMLIIARKEHV